MKIKTILTYLLIGFQIVLFSQQVNKTSITANIIFGHAPDCRGNQGICAFKTLNNDKTNINTKVNFNKESNELTLILSKTTLDQTSKLKLLHNKLEKHLYLYTFDEDFILSKELKETLIIKKLSKIKQGGYLVKVIKDQIILTLKLE